MKAAVVSEFGKPPAYGDFAEPVVAEGRVLVHVAASALSHLTKGRASGTHYSAKSAVPFVPGVDGVGRLDDGRRVYFVFPEPPYGGMAERTIVDPRVVIPLPDALDDVTAAAIANAGMSSWAALAERAQLRSGETVLINGATGSSGRLAVEIARYLGAGKIIATGRNATVLSSLGADETIQLAEGPDELSKGLDAQFRARVDVVVDYLWGESAEAILRSAATAGDPSVAVRFVQVGSVTAQTVTLPSSALRSCGLVLMGSGLGSTSQEALLRSIAGVFEAAAEGKLHIEVRAFPLENVEAAWSDDQTASRTVFTIG